MCVSVSVSECKFQYWLSIALAEGIENMSDLHTIWFL